MDSRINFPSLMSFTGFETPRFVATLSFLAGFGSTVSPSIEDAARLVGAVGEILKEI